MSSLNVVHLIGNLGQDPEVRYMPSGDAMCSLSLATNEKWKDKAGEQQERTEWHRIVFFGKPAEIIGEYMSKGGSMYVSGKLQTRKWQDKDGNDRYTTEIVGRDFQFLGGKSDDSGRASQRGSRDEGGSSKPNPRGAAAGSQGGGTTGRGVDDLESDIPFVCASIEADPLLRKQKGLERW